MADRNRIPKYIRFEVFKRDKFTCQYCGRKAPEVNLELDHIIPVSKGGKDDMINLVTSCFDCNRGKSARELSDTTIIDNERKQIEELQDRNEQLKMLLEWREELQSIEDRELEMVNDLVRKETGVGFNEYNGKAMKRLIKKYGLNEILESTTIAINDYYHTEDDWETMFSKIYGIADTRAKMKDDPSVYIKNRMCKYASNKYGEDFDRKQFMGFVERCHPDESKEKELFDILKENKVYMDALVGLDIYRLEHGYEL